MVRGYEKRVVRLSDPGSPYFEEVFFVLRDEAAVTGKRERDIVAEAGRILEENTKGREKRGQGAPRYLYVLLGAALAVALLSPFLFF